MANHSINYPLGYFGGSPAGSTLRLGRNIADPRRDLWFEKGASAVICVFYGLSGNLNFGGKSVDPAIATDPGASVAAIGIGSQFIILTLIVLLLVRRFHHVLKDIATLHWGGILAVLAVVSTLWSQDPSITMRRAISFLFATLFALYFASRFDQEEQLSILWRTMIVLAAISVLVCFIAPAYGLDPTPGRTQDWRGIFVQKQSCGRAMVLAIALTLMQRGRFNLARALSLLLFLFLLAMSGSRTFWLVGLSVFALAFFMNFIKRYDLTSRAIIVLISVVLSIVIITASVMFGAEILALLGRDTTLTGRTDIWQAVWQSILKRPMLGYGFAGFWIGMKGEAINVIASVLWDVPHAHNGFLEIMLQLGVIGMAIFILSYLRACSRAWTMIRSQYIEQAIWPIFALFLILICNLDENTLLSFNGIFWVIYIVALVNLELMVPLVAQVPVRRVATLWAVRE